MFNNRKNLAITSAIIIVIVAGLAFWIWQNSRPGKLDDFAKCLEEKKAQFYGAFWCPHCQNQKKMFGNSATYLPYIECSTSNGQGQLSHCKEKKIEGYPTWIFSDGSRESGELSLAHLAEKTTCKLPEGI